MENTLNTIKLINEDEILFEIIEEFDENKNDIIDIIGLDETDLNERLTKHRVIRDRKIVKKWKTDKEGYKVDMSSGTPKEVKMSATEKRIRAKAAKKSAKKSKNKRGKTAMKRARSMKKTVESTQFRTKQASIIESSQIDAAKSLIFTDFDKQILGF